MYLPYFWHLLSYQYHLALYILYKKLYQYSPNNTTNDTDKAGPVDRDVTSSQIF